MQHALRLAERGLGRTWPNPSVGAVVVKKGAVLGAAVTAWEGRPHAETRALEQAGENATGATLFVTLEPCAHTGKTPPCTDAIIAAGIKRVVIAVRDTNPKAMGGVAKLQAAGIEIVEGVCEAEARAINEGFFSIQARGRPFVTLKLATSLDGKIALGGESQWITGEQSRRHVHVLRATHDAVVTGIGTIFYDDPKLTCRLSGREVDSPQRILMDSNLRVPENAKLLPAWIFTSEAALRAESDKASVLEKNGNSIFPVPLDAAHLSLSETMKVLAQKGVTRLLVEAGSTLASEFMRQGLVDRLYWFRAPMVIGDKGIPALWGQDATSLANVPRFSLQATERYGGDILEIYNTIPA
jgi:diaminohydroxyphosphoribosylaminopyrimidine deaminase/5-amino-6-(5-phosphoribosylamino)uracil reductase